MHATLYKTDQAKEHVLVDSLRTKIRCESKKYCPAAHSAISADLPLGKQQQALLEQQYRQQNDNIDAKWWQ